MDDLLTNPRQIGTQALQNLSGNALALAHQTEEHVLGSDVAVTELQRLAQGQLENLLGPGREGRRARRGGAGQADGLLDLLAHSLQRDAQ